MTSGEGDLPEGWAWSTIGEILGGSVFTDGDWVESKDQDPDGPVRLVQLADVGEGEFRDRSDRWMNELTAERLNCTYLRQGDVLFARMPDPIGRACLVPDLKYPAVTVVDVCVIRPGGEAILPAWLMWALNSPEFRDCVVALESGTTRRRISRKNLATIAIPVPPRPEQEQIVAAVEEHLSRLDAAEAGVQSSQARLRVYWAQALAASFSEFDVSRPVGELAEVRGGIQKQPKRKPVKDTAPFLRVANVLRGRLELEEIHRIELFDGELDRYRLEEGDLLVVEGNGSPEQIGRAARWTDEVPGSVHQNHLIRVRPGPELDPDFLDLYWNAPTTASVLREVASSTSGLYTLSTRKVKDVPVPVASLDRQRAVADELRNAQTMIARLETELTAELARGQALRRSILAAAFSGRLVAQNPSDESADILLARIAEERSAVGTERRPTTKSLTKRQESSS